MIQRQYFLLKKPFPQSKRVESIFLSFDGQMDFVVLVVERVITGLRKGGDIDAGAAMHKYLLQQVPFFKIHVFHCVFGFVLFGI